MAEYALADDDPDHAALWREILQGPLEHCSRHRPVPTETAAAPIEAVDELANLLGEAATEWDRFESKLEELAACIDRPEELQKRVRELLDFFKSL
jgi:hypothetical protein